MRFKSSDMHATKKWQSTEWKTLELLKETFEVSIKIFPRKWEGETLAKWFFIYKQLEKCQNEYYPDNPNLISFWRRILASLHILMFPISLLKKESVIILKMDKLLKEKFGHFS